MSAARAAGKSDARGVLDEPAYFALAWSPGQQAGRALQQGGWVHVMTNGPHGRFYIGVA